MQNEEDKKIQRQLEAPEKGLPGIDSLFLRYLVFPLLKAFMSWDVAMSFLNVRAKEY
jgi:hypothetical protein